ncbi:MAG: carbon-nitrogen hydrolase family protein [Clostridiales bacterium]|nr:carbon-nitrogen hydrolase family protein [Clostridiales bacterium]MCF8023062.1 carbon-nitrogen hydrolase family protein [Clostridiales bacterium]
MSGFKLSICQVAVGRDKKDNIGRAREAVNRAAGEGAKMVVLPEMFNCPFKAELFPEYAESFEDGETTAMLKDAARENNIYLVGGSIPEREGQQVYNSSFIFGPGGDLLGCHRKMHLFDVDLPGGPSVRESSTLGRGEDLTFINTELCRFGVAICFDVRFPELMRALALSGARLIVIPAAFNTTSGPAHWEITMRARAVDNQVYIAAASPARGREPGYVVYGHSTIVEPWGQVLVEAGEGEEIITAEIDLDHVEKVRREIPLLDLRRSDLYDLKWKK